MKIDVEIRNDHTDDIINALHDKIPAILEAMAIEAEGNAVTEITNLGAVDTGRLRGSITHAVNMSEEVAYVGTNVEYAPYVEFGTYKMAPRPFLKNAVVNYSDDYKRIIEMALE